MEEKPINLNKARKARARAAAKARADQNAALHGLTKAERYRAKAEEARVISLHDASKRARPTRSNQGPE